MVIPFKESTSKYINPNIQEIATLLKEVCGRIWIDIKHYPRGVNTTLKSRLHRHIHNSATSNLT